MLPDLVAYLEDDYGSRIFVGRGYGVDSVKRICERRSRADVKIRWTGKDNNWVGVIPGKPKRYRIGEAPVL